MAFHGLLKKYSEEIHRGIPLSEEHKTPACSLVITALKAQADSFYIEEATKLCGPEMQLK